MTKKGLIRIRDKHTGSVTLGTGNRYVNFCKSTGTVKCSVVDPGCLSRIRPFLVIPDPDPGSYIKKRGAK
jgi:hypothetical protein